MNTLIPLYQSWKLAVVGGLLLLVGPHANAQVLINNPGFETGSPADWTTVGSGAPPATFTWVTGTAGNEVHTGIHAVSITDPLIGNTQNRWQQTNASRFSVSVGTTYTVGLWVKGENLDLATDQFRVTLEWWNAAGTGIVSSWVGSATSLSANGEWEQYFFDSPEAPVGAATAKLLLNFVRGGASTSTLPAITFDDISVTAVPEPSSFALVVLGLGGVLAARKKCRHTM